MSWFTKKEPIIKPSEFQYAWLCQCGYITNEHGMLCGRPAVRFCEKCGAIAHIGTLLIGKWDCSIDKIEGASRISLISFDIYQINQEGSWVNCHGTYPPVYVKADHEH
jgi:hypothetical protein